ncbi:hypothetical protein BDP27DRAFT_1428858 [Rhodocollybia butyracea]|uniref:Uncharacterized protein n=1 Tax=Rhodocollybia butyracea TaxID=206335 RepID=A0A9P5PDN1_9AGAR|nr:hypothetical protein BDP27DRAFT_1428858 [Rhodocollybia butyracea]
MDIEMPERGKALMGILITATTLQWIGNYHLNKFTLCRDPCNRDSNHPLKIGLGEQLGKNRQVTFATLSVLLCALPDCRVLLKKYAEWLMDVNGLKGMTLVRNKLTSLMHLDNDHPNVQAFYMCLTWSIHFHPTSNALATYTPATSASGRTQSLSYQTPDTPTPGSRVHKCK